MASAWVSWVMEGGIAGAMLSWRRQDGPHGDYAAVGAMPDSHPASVGWGFRAAAHPSLRWRGWARSAADGESTGRKSPWYSRVM